MSPHEALVSETREWLERARADLDACDALIAAGLAGEALLRGARFLSRRRTTSTNSNRCACR
jgi:hypothetical protein